MKKLLLGVLTTLSFFSLAGCQGGGKKLSADEAKTELKAVAESTMKESANVGTFKTKESFKASISAKNVKAKMNELATVNYGSGKISANINLNTDAKIDTTNKIAKVSGSVDAGVNYNLNSPALKSLSSDIKTSGKYSAKASADAYYVSYEEDFAGIKLDAANIYTNYNAEISKDLAEIMESTETKFSGKNNFKTYEFGGLFSFFDMDEDDEESSIDFDFINDWTIFTKSGNTISADCSNLAAFDLGYDLSSTQKMLKEYGLDFKVSKFQISFNKDNVITAFDFAMSLKGSADIAKVTADEDGESIYSGTVSVDLSFGLGFELGYSTQSITVPEELTKLEEEDFDEISEDFFDYLYDSDIMDTISGLIGGGSSYGGGSQASTPATKKAENLLSCMKQVALETSAQAENDFVTVMVDYGNTPTNNPTIKVLDGTTDVTNTFGFSGADVMVDGLKATGSFSIRYSIQFGNFVYSGIGENALVIDGKTITISSEGKCVLAE